jgi:caa(3)-type oxidase subunit IV
MASKKTKSDGGGVKKAPVSTGSADEKKAEEKADEKKAEAKAEAKREVAEAEADEHAEHGHAAGKHGAALVHAEAHASGHAGHAPNIREYFMIFAVLAVLTVVEVAVAKVPGIDHTLMGIALVTLAVTKAAIVGLFYMHLKHETRIMKMTVAIPLAAPAFYALVLISEAAWRLARF